VLAGACLAIISVSSLARSAEKIPEYQAVAATDDLVLLAESKLILTGSDGNPRSWFIMIPHLRQATDQSDYARMLYVFDCKKRMSAVQSLSTYDRDDTPLYSTDLPLQWTPAPTDSVQGAALDYACADPERRPQIGVSIKGSPLKKIVEVVTAPDWGASPLKKKKTR